jgi:hypothetical protein
VIPCESERKTMKTKLIAIAMLITSAFTANAETDAQLNAKLVGYWESRRHAYAYLSNGTWRMLPSDPLTTHGFWDIRAGILYEHVANDSSVQAYKIIKLNNKELIIEDLYPEQTVLKKKFVYHMIRVSQAEAETY